MTRKSRPTTFAARFVEASKSDFAESDSPTRSGTLATFDYVMSHVLRLLHPFAPFVTEELWCELGFGTETIQTTLWPRQTPKSKSKSCAPSCAAGGAGTGPGGGCWT